MMWAAIGVAALALAHPACRDGGRPIAGPESASEGASVPGESKIPEKHEAAASTEAAAAPPSAEPPRAPGVDATNSGLTDARFEGGLVKKGAFDDPELQEALLAGNDLTARSLEILARTPATGLRHLAIEANPIGDAGARLIAAEPFFRGLRILTIGDPSMTAAGLESLLGADSGLSALERLELHHAPIGNEAAKRIAASPLAAKLGSLGLVGVGLTDAGVVLLSKSAALGGLQVLDLSGNPLTAKGAGALVARASKLKSLQSLRLRKTPVGDDAIKAIASSEAAARLHTLDLTATKLTDKGAEILAAAPALSSLEVLFVGATALTTRGKSALHHSRHLQGCQIYD
jgi:hypothetical protein